MIKDWYRIRLDLTPEQSVAVAAFYEAAWDQIRARIEAPVNLADAFERGTIAGAENAQVDIGMVYLGLGDPAWHADSKRRREEK